MIPPFVARRGLAGGHRQTLAGAFLPGRLPSERALQHHVSLIDGETVVIHDDRPADWLPGGRTAVLIHGLAGCHRSGYLVRIAAKLNARGVRTFRMDLRGSGAGAELALKPYHGGCSDDLLAVVRFVERLSPQSEIMLFGFSLGGNIVLKLLGEAPHLVPANVVRAAAVNPPVDLAQSVLNLGRPSLKVYDRYFVRLLLRRLNARKQQPTDTASFPFRSRPRCLFDFDDQYTAPQSGFRDARDYYARCSSAQFLPSIRVPTLILTSGDDPLVPVAMFNSLQLSSDVRLHIAEGGGHLGYFARRGNDPDERWLDWRIVDWALASRND